MKTQFQSSRIIGINYLMDSMLKFGSNHSSEDVNRPSKEVWKRISVHKRDNMRIDLRHDEMVYIKELGDFLDWQITI